MNKETKKLIPELRFPEFLSDRNWEERFVEELFSVGSSKRVLQEDWTSNGVPFYRTRELVSLSKNEPFGSEIFISEDLFLELSEKYGIPAEGDFLVSGVGTLGICYQVKAGDRFYFKDGNVLWFKLESGIDSTYIDSTYFKFCFQSDHIQKQIVKQTSISTVGTYTIQNAKKTTLWYPPKLNEQQKIASCLSSLDEVIAAHSQKLELLKDHKKGLMQNLFPQEGETVPKLRFPEFVNDGEWVERTLGEIGDFIGGGTPDTTREEYWNGNIQWYTPTEVKEGILEKSIRTITEEGLSNSSAKLLPKGALLITTRATIGDIAIANSECTTNQGFQSLVVNKEEVNIFWYFWIIHHKNELKRKSSGSTFPEIGKNEIVKIKVIRPEKAEQKKIASCLSSLDELITAQTEKIEQLKLHKKGLMQGLFPNSITN